MKTKLLLLLPLINFWTLKAQNLDGLSFGTNSTFEVVTWNIEHFPKKGTTTMNYVQQIIEHITPDIIAFQEINYPDSLIKVAKKLNADHYPYKVLYKNTYSQDLAYMYDTTTITVKDYYQIYTDNYYWNVFPRAPQVLKINYKGETIYIINNHLKCCGDGILVLNNTDDEEYRRYMACNYLKYYVDNTLKYKNVIIVGDMNDEITDDLNNNLKNNVFKNFLLYPAHYQFADWKIATGNSADWSYPKWPSHLDHILVTKQLIDELQNSSTIVRTLKIDSYLDGGYSEYDDNVSDHRPVGFEFVPNYNTYISKNKQDKLFYYTYSQANTNIKFFFPQIKSNAKIDIYTVTGIKIKTFYPKKGQINFSFDANTFSEGVYIAQLIDKNYILTTKFTILR
jgi:endonuclease/exonuclease/phosphatase family metal-dependent hydrolase